MKKSQNSFSQIYWENSKINKYWVKVIYRKQLIQKKKYSQCIKQRKWSKEGKSQMIKIFRKSLITYKNNQR